MDIPGSPPLARGLEALTIHGLKPGSDRIDLTFCSTRGTRSRFKVSANGIPLPAEIRLTDPFQSQTAILESVKSRGDLNIRLEKIDGTTQLSGMELRRIAP